MTVDLAVGIEVQRDGKAVPVLVRLSVHKGPSPKAIEVRSVEAWDAQGNNIELTDREIDHAEDKAPEVKPLAELLAPMKAKEVAQDQAQAA